MIHSKRILLFEVANENGILLKKQQQGVTQQMMVLEVLQTFS